MTQISFLHPTPVAPVPMTGKRVSVGDGCERMTLRPYQEDAKNAVLEQWRSGVQRTLLVLVTGGGKTIIFSKVIEELVRKGERVLVMAHRGELLDQAADKLEKATGLKCATEKAERSCLDDDDQRWYRVVVGSVQSLMRPQRLERFPKDYFSAIVVDEAHHVLAEGYRRILDHFSDAKVLGVTATPDRGDMRNLGAVFESLAYEYTLPRAVREGFLCRIEAMTIPLRLDISGVKLSGGDYAPGGLGDALDPYLEQIAEEMAKVCLNRKTVVFLPLIATSQKMRGILEKHGFRAAEVNGNSADREQVLAAFDRGETNVLCNSMPCGTKRLHQTEKPVPLLCDLMKICPAGGKILDPFMGSGAAIEAALIMGHDCTGIEITDYYYDVATTRIGKFTSNNEKCS